MKNSRSIAILSRAAFGWNFKAWVHPLLQLEGVALFEKKRYRRILEIGAGRHSCVSLIFDGYADEIVVGYYGDSQREEVVKRVQSAIEMHGLVSKYSFKKVDAHTVEGDYDVVVMKSVLGGLFRTDSSELSEVSRFILDLKNRTLVEHGCLVTIDNGRPFFEPMLKKFGARKNAWRFFRVDDLKDADETRVFGYASAFSCEMRLGKLGEFVDNAIIYNIDRLLYKWSANSPTIILSVYKLT